MTPASTLPRAAKVAPIGAKHPLMQDENSGKDGRRFNEWLANRADSRRRAREAAEDIRCEQGDEGCSEGNVPMGLAAAMPFLIVFLGVGGLAAWPSFLKAEHEPSNRND
jgi:hypothetical protein